MKLLLTLVVGKVPEKLTMAEEHRLSKERALLGGLSMPEERLERVLEAFASLAPAICKMMELDLGDVEPALTFGHRERPWP